MNVDPDFGAASVTVRAGTDEATDETFVVDAWCT
jgi:hypothetical protein